MTYRIQFGLSNHSLFDADFAASRLGLILGNHIRYRTAMSFKIFVQVKTQARKDNILKISQQAYQVSVHAAPVAGKANREVVELLARYFSVPKSSVRVLRGQSSRKKLVEID